MPIDSIICRRNLDEQRGNPQICECPMCREAKRSEKDEGLFHGDGAGQRIRSQPKNNLPEAVGEGATCL